MLMPNDFISGFASAIQSLGREGDDRGVDWSAPFEYLKTMLQNFEPENATILTRLRSRRRLLGDLADDAASTIEHLSEAMRQIVELETLEDGKLSTSGEIAKKALTS